MTSRVTTLKGAEAGAYYVEALPSYYLDSDEPPGRWHGMGAERLGLIGHVVDEDFLDVMAGVRPCSGGATLGRSFGENSVRGFDVTSSAPKSVSTMFALGDDYIRMEVLGAHDVAVAAQLRWIEDHAHTRFRINGEVAVVDAQGIVAATFRQHTSRALDPQIHTHLVIANRVLSPDGRWLALDARTLKMDQRTLSAVYHSTLRSEMTSRLGVTWQPVVNGIAEIAHIDNIVLEEFSSRTLDIARRTDEKLDRFIDTFERDPTPRERWRLEREAVIDSRPPKTHGVDSDDLHAAWSERIEGLGLVPYDIVDEAISGLRPRNLTARREQHMIEDALGALTENQSSWRPAEIARELAAVLPSDLGLEPASIPGLLDRLTDRVVAQHCVDISRPIPDGVVLRRDGRPVTESAADRAITTPEILAQEERLMAWAERRMSHDSIDSPDAPARATVELTVPQAETAAAVAGDAHLVLVVGPAGTGKTTALQPAVAQLHTEGRAVFGVAPSAAEVLATETGAPADTIDKLLIEHSLKQPPSHLYDLPVGATVIVDEAAMVATDKLDRLAALADDRGWRIALVGDPMQFSAVGRGGTFEHLIGTHQAIELDQVHRFINAWEREASLRIRRGDSTVAEVYDVEGRLQGGTSTRMRRQALDAWWTARHNGETVLLTAPTNETVGGLNLAAQQRRIKAGELDPRRHLPVAQMRLHVGDDVVTRRNSRLLHTDRGLMIRNRDQWTVTGLHRNGDLTVAGQSGTVRLPSHYANEHVELGYAQTSYASQGRTVDRSILVLDGPTDVRGVYVAMTRGRHHNSAYITTSGEQTAVDVFADAIGRSWIDQPALARQAELSETNRQRPGTLAPSHLRELYEQRAQLTNTLDRLDDDLAELPGRLHRAKTSLAGARDKLDTATARLQGAFDTVAERDRPFRRRGHEQAIADAHRTIEILPDKMRTYTASIGKHTADITGLERNLAAAKRLDQRRPAITVNLRDLDHRLGDDRRVRSRTIRRDPPDRITNTIGRRPRSGEPARAWDVAAGQLDQHQTTFNIARGIGPTRPPRLGIGYLFSRKLTDQAVRPVIRTIDRQRNFEPAITRPGPRIGR